MGEIKDGYLTWERVPPTLPTGWRAVQSADVTVKVPVVPVVLSFHLSPFSLPSVYCSWNNQIWSGSLALIWLDNPVKFVKSL